MTEDEAEKTEDRGRKTENGRQRTESRVMFAVRESLRTGLSIVM